MLTSRPRGHLPEVSKRIRFVLTVTLATVVVLTASALPSLAQPNILFILADDLGLEHLDFYGIGTQFAPTPNLTQLANDGVVFQNAWSNPNCSPTRVTIHTGRYPFRTKLGAAISPIDQAGMALEELTLPELLKDHTATPYATGAFGKWHMGRSAEFGGLSAPNMAGYDYFEGVMANLDQSSYYSYDWNVNGVESPNTEYVTSYTVDRATDWINNTPGPWFAHVSFNALHSPWEWPPQELHTQDIGQEGILARYRAMAEALDNEIDRLLDTIDTTNTLIIFAADNGSPSQMTLPPFNSARSKGTVFEGGIRVPLFIAGDVVSTTGSVDSIVNLSDLFATIGDFAGATIPGDIVTDSISLTPYLDNPGAAALRDHIFSQVFFPNGEGPYAFGQIAARNSQYKYMRNSAGAEGLADLSIDPFETTNLMLDDLTDEQADALDELKGYIDTLLGLCSLGRTGESCSVNEDCCSGRCRGRGNRRRCRAITEF